MQKKNKTNPGKCRLCGDRDETVNTIISEWSKLAQKEYKSGQGDPLGIMWEIEVWPYEQIVYAQPNICPGEWHTQTPLGFWDTNELSNHDQTTRHYNNQQKKREFAVLSTLLSWWTTM